MKDGVLYLVAFLLVAAGLAVALLPQDTEVDYKALFKGVVLIAAGSLVAACVRQRTR